MAFKKKNKTGGQVEEGRESKKKAKHISALALPTCHSTHSPY